MKYEVDGWNNFCRVFELPIKYSSEFCFGGGIPTNFQMVDWFNPVQGLSTPAISKENWLKKYGKVESKIVKSDDLEKELIPWLKGKTYIKGERTYLVICDFGAAFIFKKE